MKTTLHNETVELNGFSKSYALRWNGPRLFAVHSLTLKVAAGQVLGLLGPNGSGKSTTLKALAGLITPSAGTCYIGGHIAGSDAARARVGYLAESPQFSAHQTGRAFLNYCAGLSSLTRDQASERVEKVLEWSGLKRAAKQRIGTYSKGMRQRIGLAQAILHDPAVVLLDEPASGLDPEGRLALVALIRDLAAQNKIVIFSSHLLAQAETVCDRIAILGRGRLLAEGTPPELLGSTGVVSAPSSPLEKLYLEKLHEHECVNT